MAGKRKICFVSLFAYGIFNPSANLKFGGSETQMYFLAKKLAADPAFDVSFIVLDVGQKEIELRHDVKLIKAYQRGGGIFKIVSGFFKLMAALRRADPDVIICRAFGREVGVSALYAKLFGKKLIYCLANDEDATGKFFKGLSGKIFQLGFLLADHYVAQSQQQVEEFSKRFKSKTARITVIKNSWPSEAVPPAEREFVLWVGSSADLKRPEIFLNLAKDFPREKFVMVMTRSKMNEKKWDETSARVSAIANLRLIESVPLGEIDYYFTRAKVLVSTSSSEGFPNVFLQAARARTPILSLAVDPDRFIARNEGGIVADNDYEKLKDGLKLLLNKDERDIKGENLYRYFKAEHDLDNNIKKWEQLLRVL